MNLLVDIGNSRIKWALQDGARWLSGAPRDIDADWADLFAGLWSELARPEAVAAVCVAGDQAEAAFAGWVAERWQRELRYLRAERAAYGLRNSYYDADQLGDDRWAALIGARTLAAGVLGAIDCGTAITLDIVDAGGEFRGGLIIPGFDLAERALPSRTARIGERSQAVTGLLGRSTAECVTNGVHHATLGGVAHIKAAIESEFSEKVTWFMTGGAAPRVIAALGQPIHHEPDLVLKGLSVVLEHKQ